jgi:hypothetical protein
MTPMSPSSRLAPTGVDLLLARPRNAKEWWVHKDSNLGPAD